MTGKVRAWTIGAIGAGLVVAWLFVSSREAESKLQAQGNAPPQQAALKYTAEDVRKISNVVRVGRVLTPKQWPNGARVAVNLGYDVDNIGLARGVPPPVQASSREYGAVDALPRILATLAKYQVPATFYMPASSAIINPEMIQSITKTGGHEIALHGWVHEGQASVNNAEEEARLLKQSIDYFEKVTGKKPVGTRAPGWGFSQNSLLVISRSGLMYDSSMMGLDEPYELVANGQPTGIIELPVEWIQDDAPYLSAPSGGLPSPELTFKVYKDEFDGAYKEGTLFMLTFHPHHSGHRSRIAEMEKLIEYMKSKPGVWFATAEQIAAYVKQQSMAR